jgi:filamentous hemagglutinin family protein
MPGNANQHSRFRVKPLCTALLFCFSAQATTAQHAQANPGGASVISGHAGFAASGNTLTITNTPGAILHWQDFSIGANEITRFAQQSAFSTVLNRVTGANPSSILGSLQSNGRVFLINPHGIVFGQGAMIDTAGFIASTLDISDRDFLEGRLRFEGGGNGALKNGGTIRAEGDIYLVGPQVENTGLIRSDSGSVLLAAGQSVTITGPDAQGLQFALQAPEDAALNLGAIEAKNAAAMFAGTLRHSGDIRANRVTLSATGEATLEADSIVTASGDGANVLVWSDDTAHARGTISAKGAGGKGGFVETSARTLDVNGIRVDTGGGEWLIDPNDFTIAASGGNMTGATLSANLGSGNVTILSSSGGVGSGDIHVNDAVSWSANLLTLTAARDINLNAVMTASGTSRLELNPATANGADGAVAGGTVKVGMNGSGFTGRVDFPGRAGTLFLIINGLSYYVLDGLGAEGSTSDTDLQGMSSGGGRYALGSDIDASATSTWNAGLGFNPIGTSASHFIGQFNGLGHTISNLTINRPAQDYVGLFSYSSATVANVGLSGGSIRGDWRTGGIVAVNFGTISNSYNTGDVIGTQTIVSDGDTYGGLAAYNYGSITNSYATGNVSGDSIVGGLVGSNSGSISNSYSTGAVAGSASYGNTVGGLVGNNSGGSISNSHATGNVSGIGNVGGLAGYNAGTISNSYGTGAVNGTGNHIGGLVGYNTLGSTITASHATGAVTADALGQRYIGGLAGQNDGTIADSYSIAEVQAYSYAGALVGYNDGAISGSYSTGIVTAVYQFAGGIAGYNDIGASISASHNTGSVSGTEYVGGVTGWNDGSISVTYNTGAVSGSIQNIGGLAGYNQAVITDTYNTGIVTGGQRVGGLVGANDGSGSITDSYNAGSVTGSSFTGGLVGRYWAGAVTNSYWDTDTSGQSTSPGGGTGLTTAQMKQQANFTGWDFGATWNIDAGSSYPYLRANEQIPHPGLLSLAIFWDGGGSDGLWLTPANWSGDALPVSTDDVTIGALAGTVTLASGTHSINSLQCDASLVVSGGASLTLSNSSSFNANLNLNAGATLASQGGLSLNTYTLGAGAKINLAQSGTGVLSIGGLPYTVINSLGAAGSATGADLQGMNGNLSGRYALGADIDASGTSGWNGGSGFAPVGDDITNFAGIFDGLGHAIQWLTINRPASDNIGVFGYTSGSATIRNVAIESGSITGRQFVGGLAGLSGGAITNSHSTASVSGDRDVGGLAGWNSGTISNSYSTGNVSGIPGSGTYNQWYVGGLAGANDGAISNSFATGNVKGGNSIGGLIGWSRGAVGNSFATGSVDSTHTVNGGVVVLGNDVGGLVGWNQGNVSNSYATGSTIGMQATGGLAGFNDNLATISDSYSTGNVTVHAAISVGGLVGKNNGVVANSYWDTQTSGESRCAGWGNCVGATGLTIAQMTQQTSFTGWDFSTAWAIDTGTSYPYLRANTQTPHPVPGSIAAVDAYATAQAMPAAQTIVLNDQFFAAATASIMSTPQGEESMKGEVLICR